MRPILESLKEFRALVVALDSSPTGKLSKEMQALKTSAIGLAAEMERGLEPLPAMLEKQVAKAGAGVKTAAKKAGQAAGKAYAEGVEETAVVKLRASVPGVKSLGGTTSLSSSSPDAMFALQDARNKLLAAQQRDEMVNIRNLAPPLSNKSAKDSADAIVAALDQAKQSEEIVRRSAEGLSKLRQTVAAKEMADMQRNSNETFRARQIFSRKEAQSESERMGLIQRSSEGLIKLRQGLATKELAEMQRVSNETFRARNAARKFEEDQAKAQMDAIAKTARYQLLQATANPSGLNSSISGRSFGQVGGQPQEQVDLQRSAEGLAKLRQNLASKELAEMQRNSNETFRARQIFSRREAQSEEERMALLKRSSEGIIKLRRSLSAKEAMAEAAASTEAMRTTAAMAKYQVAQAMASPVGNFSSVSGSKFGSVVSPSDIEAAKGMTAVQKELNGVLREGHSAARGLASGFGAMWLTWGSLAPLLAGAAVSNAFVSAIKYGSEFEQRLAAIRYLGGESASAVNELANAALEMSRTGPAGPVEIADALKALSLAGLDANAQLAALKPAMNFSIAGELPVAKAAESLVAISSAFGYTAEGFGTVGDVIAKAAAISMSSVESMTESFKVASTVAQQYGVTVQDAATSLALLSQVGIRGTAAGTAMRNMYNELMGTSKRATAVLEKTLNIEIIDNATKSMRPLLDIMVDMSKGLSKLDFKSQQKALQDLGNERGLKAISANLMALNQQAKDMDSTLPNRLFEIRKALEDAPGFTAMAAIGMGLTTSNQIKGIWASLQASLTTAFAQMSPVIQGLAADLRSVFNSKEFQSALQDLVGGIAGFIRLVMDNATAIAALATGFVAGKVAVLAYTAGQALAASATLALGASAVGASAGFRVLTAAMGPIAILAAGAAAAYLFFSTRTKSAMETATFALDAHFQAAMDGMDKELERLAKERTAIEDNLSGKVAAYAVEAGLASEKLKFLNAQTRATARLAHEERLQRNGAIRGEADRSERSGDTSRAAALRRTADNDDNVSRLMFAGVAMEGYDKEVALEGKTRQVINAAVLNGRLAAEQAARNRNIPTGPDSYTPADRAGGEGGVRPKAFIDAKASADLVIKNAKNAADTLDGLFKEQEAAEKFKYDLGLKSFSDFQNARDSIQEDHFKGRAAMLVSEAESIKTAMEKLDAAAKEDNAKKPGTVTAEALENSKEALRARLAAKDNDLRALQIAQTDTQRANMLARSRDLITALEAAEKMIQSEADSLAQVVVQTDLIIATAQMSERDSAIAEARAATLVKFKKEELDLVRKIAEYAQGGDPELKAKAETDLEKLRAAGPKAINGAGKAAGGLFDAKELASSTKSINDALVEGFMKGGKEGGKALRDALQRELVSKPLSALLQGILSPLSGMLASFGASIGQNVLGAITGGGGGFLSSLGAVFGFRAAGGPVSRGNSYLVGENGPEIVEMGDSGRVYSANDTARMASAPQSSGSSVSITVAPVISIDSRSDQAQVAQMVATGMKESNKQMAEQLRQLGVIR